MCAATAVRAAPALRGRMAAWRAHAWGDALQLDAARVPALRGPNDVLLKVEAVGLNPIDAAMLKGYGRVVLGAWHSAAVGGARLPLAAGREAAGRVVAVGAAARAPAGRVWAVLPPHLPGALAEYVVVPDYCIAPAPTCFSTIEAAGGLYAALSAAAAIRCALPAQRVLLLGLGGVGQAALQLLKARGVSPVVGCAGEQAELALRLGAGAVMDRHADNYEDLLLANGPYDAILDAAGGGGRAATARGWQYTRYVTLTSPLLHYTDSLGVVAGTVRAGAELAAQNAAAARAAGGRGPWPQVRWAFFRANRDDILTLTRLAEKGQYKVQVERVFHWEEAPAALEHLAAGHARGKLVVKLE